MTTEKKENILYIDDKPFAVTTEKNLLEVVRNAGYDLPTFCYRADLSVYGACRMCVVEIEGKGIQASCTVKPEAGMKVRVNTKRTKRIREMVVKLLLANHCQDCTTCSKSGNCDLQKAANKLGIEKIDFEKEEKKYPLDINNPSVVRDPNKCILCGACVRVCREIQGKSVLDFVYRGAKTVVSPAFKKDLSKVNCTFCGQCVAVCPTGALRIKSDTEKFWQAVYDPKKKVIVQVAPAVRVAFGDAFGIKAGKNTIGLLTAALRKTGVDKVFDTTFAADLTIMEEATEFVKRFQNKENLPLMTSCCPAWVKHVEQKYPKFIPNLSTCRSPQQMFGSVAKELMAKEYELNREDICVVSIMPCTAKKAEATREEFKVNNDPDVDIVLTTQELIMLIKQFSINIEDLEEEKMDSPFGLFSGAGVIFGASGGVAEAALRTAYKIITNKPLKELDIKPLRGLKTFKEFEVTINGNKVSVAVVNTLSEASMLMDEMEKGNIKYDLVEVMACPGGCIAGAGQPYSIDKRSIKKGRIKALYENDVDCKIRVSHENKEVQNLYESWLSTPNSELAHKLLHTHYYNRKRVFIDDIGISDNNKKDLVQKKVYICVGTSCYTKGSYEFLNKLMKKIHDHKLEDKIAVKATFCLEKCGHGPNIKVDDQIISGATEDRVEEIFEKYINTVK